MKTKNPSTTSSNEVSPDVEKQRDALEYAARAFANHSGPQSTADERRLFADDLGAAALRYARAYHKQAEEFGLVQGVR